MYLTFILTTAAGNSRLAHADFCFSRRLCTARMDFHSLGFCRRHSSLEASSFLLGLVLVWMAWGSPLAARP